MLQSLLKSRLLIHRNLLYTTTTQIKSLSYKRRMQRLYNDGINVQQQSIEINSHERIRRCVFL